MGLLESKGFKSYKTLCCLDSAKVQEYFGTTLKAKPAQLLMLECAIQEIIGAKEAPKTSPVAET